MSITFQILSGERVYSFSRRELDFESTMRTVHKRLRGKAKDLVTASSAATFDILHKGIAREWLLRDDIVKPFGDRLETIRFVCSFDLEQDVLIYADSNGHIQLPLARLRESDFETVQRNEFTPFEVPSPPQLDITGFPPPYQNPSTIIPDRYFAFTSRVILDFASQWCHTLRSYYADTTFRRPAKAIISIATCDFKVEEISDVFQLGGLRSPPYASVVYVPSREPCSDHVFRVWDTIVDQDLQNALKIARVDLKERAEAIIPSDHLIYCSSPPFPDAIRLLLQALSPAFPPPPGTPVHALPLEIQDRILEHVSEGPVETARLGCLWGLGSPFLWQRRIDWPRQGGPLALLTPPTHRSPGTAVESKIYLEIRLVGPPPVDTYYHHCNENSGENIIFLREVLCTWS